MNNTTSTADTRPLMVSIRCITYNHEPYIRQCLDGFVMQKTNFRFEAIVHDDASTDGTADIIREYAEKYPDIIKPIFETENQYSKHDGSLRRIMYEACKGKYVAICEGDDYWTDSHKLQMQFDALEKYKDCVIALNRVKTIDRDGIQQTWTIPSRGYVTKNFINIEDFFESEFIIRIWTFHTSSFFIRKEMLEKNSLMMQTVFRCFPYGDMPLLLTCLLSGKGYLIQKEMGCYRLLSGGYNSMIRKDPIIQLNHELMLIASFMDLNDYTQSRYDYYLQKRISLGYDSIRNTIYRNPRLLCREHIKTIISGTHSIQILSRILIIRYLFVPLAKLRVQFGLGKIIKRIR